MAVPNTVVTNASPIIHLARANNLDVLLGLYDRIYSAEAAANDIKYPQEATDFVRDFITVLPATNRSLVSAIQSAHPKLALGEIETYALYTELCQKKCCS